MNFNIANVNFEGLNNLFSLENQHSLKSTISIVKASFDSVSQNNVEKIVYPFMQVNNCKSIVLDQIRLVDIVNFSLMQAISFNIFSFTDSEITRNTQS